MLGYQKLPIFGYADSFVSHKTLLILWFPIDLSYLRKQCSVFVSRDNDDCLHLFLFSGPVPAVKVLAEKEDEARELSCDNFVSTVKHLIAIQDQPYPRA